MHAEDARDGQRARDQHAGAVVPAFPVPVVEVGEVVAVLDPWGVLEEVQVGDEHFVEHEDGRGGEEGGVGGEKGEGAGHAFGGQDAHEIDVPGEY